MNKKMKSYIKNIKNHKNHSFLGEIKKEHNLSNKLSIVNKKTNKCIRKRKQETHGQQKNTKSKFGITKYKIKIQINMKSSKMHNIT